MPQGLKPIDDLSSASVERVVDMMVAVFILSKASRGFRLGILTGQTQTSNISSHVHEERSENVREGQVRPRSLQYINLTLPILRK